MSTCLCFYYLIWWMAENYDDIRKNYFWKQLKLQISFLKTKPTETVKLKDEVD